MKRAFFRLLFALAIVAGGVGWFFRAELRNWWQQIGQPVLVTGKLPARPDPERYKVLKDEVERWRLDLGKRYRAAGTSEKEEILDEAAVFLQTALPDLMSCWLGTPWDFNGTSETPGDGKIACGYFVATVLRDAGFKVDRYKLARQPSQNILRTFLPRDELSLRVGRPYEEYAGELRGMDSGIRIVGLDTHVGFIVTRPDGFRFVHSSGSRPWCVVDEEEAGADVLRRSNYRVQGSLTANRDVVRKWLLGERFKVKGS
ncbi:conserved hypothetical protein [Haloferula helveola]|uniref:DUF1287 domain-containing protein n=1 Tax=Haloferula helveola TaxID=490095 RepID=A0ABM7RIB9_9BACT|nr:conserved hypothetical protein [Haloferula helveola]